MQKTKLKSINLWALKIKKKKLTRTKIKKTLTYKTKFIFKLFI